MIPFLLLPLLSFQDAPPAVAKRTPIVATSAPTVLLDVDDLVEGMESPLPDANETAAHRKGRATTEFAGLLERWMDPPFDQTVDRIEVVAPGQLAVCASADKLGWTGRFCELQRRAKPLIDVQFSIVEAPRGAMKSLGIESATRTFDKPAEFDAFLARVKNLDGVNFLSAPRLVTFPRSLGSLSAGDPVSYIADWRMEIVEPGPRSIGVPTVATILDGLSVESRAFLVEENLFGLELKFTSTRVERPIPTKKIRIGTGEGHEVEVGLPVANKVGLDTRMKLADGASHVLVALSSDEGREVAVTVTLRRVEPGSEPR